MSTRNKWLSFFIIPLLGILLPCTGADDTTGSVVLYTPYTKITIPPGQTANYTIDVFNNSKEIKNVDVSLSNVPRGWTYTFKSGGWDVSQISILANEKRTLNITMDVPLKVNKGTYRFNVVAGGFTSLPLYIVVSEQGTYKTELTSKQINIQGNANSTFTYNVALNNRTAEIQLYALRADAPRGWNVTFKSSEYKQVTSVNVEANTIENLSIDIKPPDRIEAKTYKIPITAQTGSTSATIELEVQITGSYNMELTTPNGLLSTSILAGEEKRIDLVLKNTGSSDLKDIALIPSAPANWEVTFDPKRVPGVPTGGETQITATIKADKKALAGDYVTHMEAKTPEISSKVSFRITVKTPMLYGWIGVFIIIIALGSVYYLFRKYGRR